MPSFFQHDRSDALFPMSSRTHRKPVLPVTPITRVDIENRLKKSLEQRLALKQIYKQQTNTHRLKPVPRLQLFSDPVANEPPTNGSSSGSLSLHGVRDYSLFEQVDRAPPSDKLTMQVQEYTKQRREAVDEQGNPRPLSLSIEIPDPVLTQDDILQEVLNDAALWSASTTQFVVTPQEVTVPVPSTAATSERSSPAVPRTPPASVPPPTSAPALPTPSTSTPQLASPLGLIPERHLPVFATPLQQQLCDQITQQSTAFDKISFEKIVGFLNHPVVAMADGCEQVDGWDGSGKTKFIKRLVEHMQREQMAMKVVIATYDNDTESFLYSIIKTTLNLPCERINSVLDDAWEREYGVVFETRNSGVSLRASQADADFIIAFDIRLRPGNPLFSKVSSKRGPNPPEVIWLFTVGSLEHRAITFFNTHADGLWDQNWWSNNPEYQKIIYQSNAWPEEEQDMQQVTESVTTWAKNNCSEHYMFIQRQPTPPAQEPVIPESTIPPDESSDMEIDSDNEEEELPESVKAQVRQFFVYPALHPSFDPPRSRASSPRNRNRNNRWRESNTECEEDEDDVASFYSASEYVQDIKPLPVSDSESSLIIGNNISSKLNSLKPAFEQEYQAIIAKLQAQYNAEMRVLQAKYEQQAYQKLRNP